MEFIIDTLAKVGFDWRMGLFNLINFFIVFLLVKRFIFPPLLRVIDERKKMIQEGLDNFTQSKTAMEVAEKKAKEIISQAKKEGNVIVEKSHDEAKAVAETMRSKAKEDVEKLVLEAKAHIKQEKIHMKEEIRTEAVSLVIDVTKKLLGKEMDTKKSTKNITDILKSVE
ncbi:MAG: F0F1 ATP synthase subunit B [Candidatus Magasanikbacteria bacterium]|jgi:F-type H+-transporting ATPase subunit b|nr:F0F1 ATP synthase subunit B [Candidatus Magasanikbacteria bacterium]MBT5262789.1 F0F1 ATP synthase subunit B [Candidatus Magasanikbacteria bacterium]MBT5820049.1 F0F1 ATP synthase subunit B [Candidatus Magasanikbacteria bacterium]MBT6294371.1 F0F1 ATP synthase subunit B [Candidatus Magasanikbacteria bacterium]